MFAYTHMDRYVCVHIWAGAHTHTLSLSLSLPPSLSYTPHTHTHQPVTGDGGAGGGTARDAGDSVPLDGGMRLISWAAFKSGQVMCC
jgi:hypothetical protein